MRQITAKDITLISHGAMYLGAGGGGDTTLTQIMAKQAIQESGSVKLISPFEFDDNSWVIPVAVMGSTTIFNEKVPSTDVLQDVLRDVEKGKGITTSAVTGIEIGGMNALTPILTAAITRLPVLDSDGMGRAFPELQMTTYHAFGIQAGPFFMRNERGDSHCIVMDDNAEIEQEARKQVLEMGGWAAVACYPMQGNEIRETGVLQTFSLAKRLGEAVLSAGADVHRVFSSVDRIFHNSIYGKPVHLIEGKIVELRPYLHGHPTPGRLIIEGTGHHSGEQMEILFQNEYLLAKQGQWVMTSVPDIISVLDADTGYPMLIDELENHTRVWAIAIPSPSLLREPSMLEVVSPEKFGLPYPFVPIERLISQGGGSK